MSSGSSSTVSVTAANHTHIHIINVVSSLFLNPEYSDLTIVCGETNFPVHKNVVCPRSEYFHRACYGGFRESSTSVIRLDDKDPWVILKVLEFIYKGTYTYDLDHPWSPDLPQDAESSKMNGRPPASSSGAGSVGSVVTRPINPGKFYLDMRMLGEADYFMLDDLRDELTDRLYESLPEMIRGENLEYYPYRKDCLKDDNFIMIVQEMYSTRCDYENLRESFIHDLVTIVIPGYHCDHTRRTGPVIDSELLKMVPEFCHDLCQQLLERKFWPHNCDHTLDRECGAECMKYRRMHWGM